MVIINGIGTYALLWLITTVLLSFIPGRVKDRMASCKCGKDFRFASKDLCVAILLLLPLSLPIVLFISIRTALHQKRCLVKLVGDV